MVERQYRYNNKSFLLDLVTLIIIVALVVTSRYQWAAVMALTFFIRSANDIRAFQLDFRAFHSEILAELRKLNEKK